MTATLSAAASFNPDLYYQAAHGLESQDRTIRESSQDISSLTSVTADDWRGDRLTPSRSGSSLSRSQVSGWRRISVIMRTYSPGMRARRAPHASEQSQRPIE